MKDRDRKRQKERERENNNEKQKVHSVGKQRKGKREIQEK